jgi:hypothetical protein
MQLSKFEFLSFVLISLLQVKSLFYSLRILEEFFVAIPSYNNYV